MSNLGISVLLFTLVFALLILLVILIKKISDASEANNKRGTPKSITPTTMTQMDVAELFSPSRVTARARDWSWEHSLAQGNLQAKEAGHMAI